MTLKFKNFGIVIFTAKKNVQFVFDCSSSVEESDLNTGNPDATNRESRYLQQL